MFERIPASTAAIGILLTIGCGAALANVTALPPAPPVQPSDPPPKPAFAVANPNWIYDAKVNCWALDDSPKSGASFAWTGACVGEQVSGKGTLALSYFGKLSRTMTGTFVHGSLIGQGRIEWANGYFSEGIFSEGGALNGLGERHWPSGQRYKGGFRSDKYEGHGRYDDADGSSYEGEFKAGKRDGHGIWISAIGTFTGEFEMGAPKNGVLHRLDGSEIKGEVELPRPDPAYPSPALEYPPKARRLDEQGAVYVGFTVLEDGRVDGIKLIGSSGYPELDDAALVASKGLHYLPGRIGGTAVSMSVSRKITFRLEDAAAD